MAKSHQEKTATLGDRSQALVIRASYRLIPRLALTTSYAIARTLSALLLRLLPRQRKTILGNLDVAFGTQLDKSQKREIARAMAENMIKGFFECFYLGSRFHDKVDGRATIVGREHLDHALARGKGVIAISAHFGNFTILASIMKQAHYPFHMVLRDPQSEPLARLFQEFRRNSGQQWINTTPFEQCQREILNCMRRNEIICLITDEHKRHGGVAVDFFGHPASTAIGPALLFLRTGAALLPLFMVRQEDDTHTVIIEPPLEYTPTGNRTVDIRTLTSMFTKRIEHYVRQYPDQWLWLNRRWKGLSRGDKHYRG